MINYLFFAFLASSFSTVLAQAIPEFLMDCVKWPDICDNTCNALYCHNITNVVRFNRNSSTTRPNPNNSMSSADYRRLNVGCGTGNYCNNFTEMDCDEYPYASTYDGGVGCISGGYNVSQSGTTRCANLSQNRSHGATLANFYRDFTDGTQFRVVVNASSNFNNSPVCMQVHPDGKNDRTKCPNELSGSLYRYRDTPANGFCPSRGFFIELSAGGPEIRNETSTEGNETSEEDGIDKEGPLEVSGNV